MALTQVRAFGALTGARYGSFAGKRVSRPVGVLTQPRGFGALTGRRYSSFAGRLAGETAIPSSQQGGVGGSRGAQHFYRQTLARRQSIEAERERVLERQAAKAAQESDRQRTESVAAQREMLRGIEPPIVLPPLAAPVSQAGETATRRAHNPEIPGATPGPATSIQATAVEMAAAQKRSNRNRAAMLIALLLSD